MTEQGGVSYMDGILRISLMGGQARAFLVESTHTVEHARRVHHLSHTATAALGRTLTATAVLGAMLKGENESVTCRIDGGGPLGLLVHAAVQKGCHEVVPQGVKVVLPRKADGVIDLPQPLGEGVRVNELTVLVGEEVISAGGLIIQMMPGASEAAIQSIETSAGMFMDISGTLKTDHLDGALTQLLSHLEPEVLDRLPLRYHCDCTRERVERALISLGEKELTEMIEEQHGCDVDCHFCNTRRHFSETELRELLEKAKARD